MERFYEQIVRSARTTSSLVRFSEGGFYFQKSYAPVPGEGALKQMGAFVSVLSIGVREEFQTDFTYPIVGDTVAASNSSKVSVWLFLNHWSVLHMLTERMQPFLRE